MHSLAGMNLAAQAPSPPNLPSPDLTALQNQLNVLNLQLQTITAHNQILAAKVGAPAVTPVQPLAGNITQQDDKAFPEASALAYNVMRGDAKLMLVYHHNELHARETFKPKFGQRWCSRVRVVCARILAVDPAGIRKAIP